jgi:hypothetical protein
MINRNLGFEARVRTAIGGGQTVPSRSAPVP